MNIRAELAIWGRELVSADVANFRNLYFRGDYGIGDLSGVECLTQVTMATVNGPAIRDVTPLAELPLLRSLVLDDTRVADLRPLRNAQLTFLGVIGDPDLTDLSPIADMTTLQGLRLNDVPSIDLAPVVANPSIVSLSVRGPFDCTTQADNVHALFNRGVILDIPCALHCGLAGGGTDKAKAVVTDWDRACALLENGTVKCWAGTVPSPSPPTPIDGLSDVVQLSLMNNMVTAVTSDGRLFYLRFTPNTPTISTPLQEIAGPSVAWSTNTNFIAYCALLRDNGGVACAGLNQFGQLGTGSLEPPSSSTLLRVPGLSGVRSLSGGFDTCALKDDGTVWCWGGTNIQRYSPTLIPGVTGARQYSAPYFLRDDGTVWKADSAGIATQVAGITNAIAIDADTSQSPCVLLADGGVRCWGSGNYGGLGNGSLESSLEPISVPGISTAEALAVGGGGTCVILKGGSLRCWGRLPYGGLSPDCVPGF